MAFETIEAQLTADTNQFTSALTEAADSTDGLAGSANKASMAVRALGAGVAAGAAAALGKAAKSAMGFQEQMVEVEKVTSPEIADEMAGSIKRMAGEMPVAQDQLADLAAQAGRFGVEGTENIEAFTESTAKMATATDLSANEAGEAFARLATLTNEPISNVQNVGDVVNELSNTMATASSEITDAALRSAGTLSQLGASTEDIYALNAAMNEASESSERAGTRLRRMAQEIQDPGKVEDLAAALGMTSDEFKTMRSEDPVGLFRKMAKTMGEGGSAASSLKSTLSTTSRQALTAMSQNLDGLSQAQKTANEQMGEGNSLNEEYEAAAATLSKQIQVLKNNIRNVAITVGQVLIPPLTEVVKRVTDSVQAFSEWTRQGENATKVAKGLAAAVGGGLLAFIGGLSAPIWAAIGAVAALAKAWQTDFAGIRSTTMDVVGVLRDEFGPVWDQLQATVSAVLDAIAPHFESAMGTIEDRVAPVVDLVGDRLISAIQFAAPKIVGALKAIESAADGGFDWGGPISAATDAVESAKQRVTAAVESIVGDFEDLPVAVQVPLKFIKAWLVTQLDAWQSVIRAGLAAIRGDWDDAWGILGGAVDRAVARVSDILATLGVDLDVVQQKVAAVVGFIRPKLAAVASEALALGKSFGGLKVAILAAAGVVGVAVAKLAGLASVFSTVQAAATTAFSVIRPKLVQLGHALLRSVKSGKSLRSTIGRLGKRIGVFGAAVTILLGVLIKLQKRFDITFQSIRTAVFDAWQAIVQSFRDNAAIIRNTVSTTLSLLVTIFRTKLMPIVGLVLTIFDRIRSIITEIITVVVAEVVPRLLGDLLSLWNTHMAALVNEALMTFNAVLRVINRVLGVVKQVLGATLVAINTIWREWGDEILAVAVFVFDTVRVSIVTALDAILTGIRVVLALIRGDWEHAWTLVKDFAGRTFERIKTLVTTALEGLKTALTQATTTIKNNWRGWLAEVERLSRVAWNFLETRFQQLGQFIIDAVRALANVVQNNWRGWLAAVESMSRTAWNFLETRFQQLGQFIIDAVRALGTTVQNNWRGWLAAVEGLSRTAWNFLETRFKQMGQFLIDAARELGTKVVAAFTSLKDDAMAKLRTLRSEAETKAGEIRDDIMNKIDDLPGKMKTEAKNAIDDLKQGFDDKKSSLQTKAGKIPGWIMDEIAGLGEDMKQAGKDAVSSLADGLSAESAKNSVKNAAGGVMGTISDHATGSDAETGPLSNWTDQAAAVPGVLEQEIRAGASDVGAAADRLAGAANPNPTVTVGRTAGRGQRSTAAEIRELRKAIEGMDASVEGARVEFGDGFVEFVDGRIEFKSEAQSVRAFARGRK